MPKKFVPVVAVLNMKGGVGKTTISAHVMRVLFERKKVATLLLDVDPQFNLTQALLRREEYDKIKLSEKTISIVMEPGPHVSLLEIKTSDQPPPPAADVVKKLKIFTKAEPIPLDLIPGDFSLVKYSLMDDRKKLKSVKDRFLMFIEESKKTYGLICIDCNPSSSFLTMCALHACTHILVPVRPDRYSILGLEILADFVEMIPSINPKPQVIAVLNGIPRGGGNADIQAVETELRAHGTFGARTLANVVPDTSLLRARSSYTGFATERRVPWSGVLRTEINSLVDELAGKLGL